MSTNSADPVKIAAAVAAVELEIAKREYVIDQLDEMKADHERWIVFLRNTRIPALNALVVRPPDQN